jgi:hypothetical protein
MFTSAFANFERSLKYGQRPAEAVPRVLSLQGVNMSDTPVTEVEAGRFPTERENFLTSWGYELQKKGIEKVEAALQRLTTLNVTLLGGSLVFLKDDLCPLWARALAFTLFLTSLGLSLWGSRIVSPSTFLLEFNPDIPDSVETSVSAVTAFRSRWLQLGGVALFAGMLAAVTGVLIRSFAAN